MTGDEALKDKFEGINVEIERKKRSGWSTGNLSTKTKRAWQIKQFEAFEYMSYAFREWLLSMF